MQKINQQAIEELIQAGQTQPAITIYVPLNTSVSPQDINANQIRFKNLINQAIDLAEQHSNGKSLVETLSSTLKSNLYDVDFWRDQSAGLLLCARPDSLHMFRLPTTAEEYVALDSQYHLAPVLAMLTEANEYYVLTVAQHHPKLFAGDMYGLHIAGITLPADIRTALNIDEANQKYELQGSAVGTSMKTGGYNGRGGAHNTQEEDRLKFFRMIDHIVCSQADNKRPLILAGTDSEIAEYRNISKYPQILETAINGSHADIDMEGLHAKAAEIVSHELLQPVRQAAIEEFQRLEGANPERTASNLDQITAATDAGRVDKLLISQMAQPAEKSRLIHRLAGKVWQMSGTVIRLQPADMPHGAAMVARLRY